MAQLGNTIGMVHGIEFFEDTAVMPSPDESYAGDDARVVRSLWFKEGTLDRRQQAAESLLGYNITVTGFNGLGQLRTFIRRRAPHGYPASSVSVVNTSGLPYLWAKSVPRGQGIGTPSWNGAAGGVTEWEAYRFQVLYQTLPYYVLEDDQVLAPSGDFIGLPDEAYHLAVNGWTQTRHVTRHVDESTRVVTLPNGYMKYADDSLPAGQKQPVPTGFPFNQFQAVVRYFWAEVPADAYPAQAISALANNVNEAVFDGFAKDTLLFNSGRKTPRVGPLGNRLLDVEYVFLYRPNVRRFTTGGANVAGTPFGPNAIIRVSGGVLDYNYVSSDGSSDPDTRPFPRGDFQRLFRPDQ